MPLLYWMTLISPLSWVLWRLLTLPKWQFWRLFQRHISQPLEGWQLLKIKWKKTPVLYDQYKSLWDIWRSIVLCWAARLNKEFGAHRVWLTVCLFYWFALIKNTQVFDFTNGHFQTHGTSNFNQHSFSCSTNPLLSVSLSGLSALLPILIYLLRIHINAHLIW